MSGRNAKLLKRYAATTRLKLDVVWRAWAKLNARQKAAVRRQMERDIA